MPWQPTAYEPDDFANRRHIGPSVQAPVAIGYVDATLAQPGSALTGEVRGKALPVTIAALPFVPTSFKR